MSHSVIFSGVQPTGQLHLGNYLGAIRHFPPLQQKGQCLFSIVDLHAMTVHPSPQSLKEGIMEVAAAYIAAGIDVKRSIIFVQSDVAEHSQLQWLLACHTPLGWLNRMTQFKEKAGKKQQNANLGLYSYPVLMAADVLLYRTTHVPVGEDQKQHLELARDIASAVNDHYQQDFFPLPEPLIGGHATRVMSLRDGTRKMSKSEASDQSRIHMTDDEDAIVHKIRRAKTDAYPLPALGESLEARPEAKNLLTLYAALSEQSWEAVCAEWAGKEFSQLKAALTEQAIARLAPIHQEMRRLLEDRAQLERTLADGAQRAQEMAHDTMEKFHHLLGL